MKILKLSTNIKLFFFWSVLIITSCAQPHKKEIKEINLWGKKLDTVEVILNGIDTTIISNNLTTMHDYLKTISEEFEQSLNKETGFLMNDYQLIQKEARKFQVAHKKAQEELKYTRDQLEDLRGALKTGSIEDEAEIIQYMSDERNAVEQLSKFAVDLNNWFHSTNTKFDNIQPKVKSFVDSLASVRANQ